MKVLIVVFALAAVAAAQQYQQPPVAILRQSSDITPEGNYQYSYETENNIQASEQGELRVQGKEGPAIAATGQFAYTAPDGTPISVTYVADENGFQPQGAHIPVAPAIPEAIQRAIEYNLAHPEQDKQ